MSTVTPPMRRLTPLRPFEFSHALTYFTRRAGEMVDRVEEGVYRRLFLFDGRPLLAELRPVPEGDLQLSVCATAGNDTQLPLAAVDAIAATLTRTLGLADDLADFVKVAAPDTPLSGLAKRFAGLRLISTPTPFEAFVWAVIGQQINLQVAFRLKAALVRRYGVQAAVGSRDYWTFPTPEALASASPDEISGLGLGRRKATTITSVAAAAARGTLDLQALACLPLDEAVKTLVAIHGVGPWTAQYTLLRGLRVMDAIPVSDMGLRVACGSLYAGGRKAAVQEVEALATAWRPYRGLAAFYLWFMLAGMGRSDG